MRIGVIGAGAAGLRSAMLLEAQGHEVTCFEARDRVGGRMRTIRSADGFYEAGAEWIGAGDHRIHSLLKQFGQSAESGPKGRAYWQFRGQLWLKDNLLVEIAEGHEHFLLRADELCIDLDDPPWHNVLYANLDSQTLADFLKAEVSDPLSRQVIEAIYRSNEGADADEVSLLGWLTGYLQSQDVPSAPSAPKRFPDGAQGFCERMESMLGRHVRLNMPLKRLEQAGDQVHLTFDDHEESFDRVVLAVPPPCLEDILFEPDLPEPVQDALEAYRMGRTMKIALQFKSKFWQEDQWSGALLTDLDIQETWDGSRGEGAVLLAYVNGESADRIRRSADPVASVLEDLCKVTEQARAEFIHGEVHDWTFERYTQGGFTTLPPDYVLNHWETWMHPAGLLHFAGEHAALQYGFVEGALESAERVAKEIAHS